MGGRNEMAENISEIAKAKQFEIEYQEVKK